MTNAQGPFGNPSRARPAAGGGPVIDLGQVAAAAAQREEVARQLESGQIQMPLHLMPFVQLGERLLNELSGIRVGMMPQDEMYHVPAVMPMTGPDGKFLCWAAYCMSCSNRAGAMVYPCQELPAEQLGSWPPSGLVPAGFAKSATEVNEAKLLQAAAEAAQERAEQTNGKNPGEI